MKKKRFEKKLVLTKTTLSNLDPEKLQGVKGGFDTDPGWNTIVKLCYIYSCVNCTWPVICG